MAVQWTLVCGTSRSEACGVCCSRRCGLDESRQLPGTTAALSEFVHPVGNNIQYHPHVYCHDADRSCLTMSQSQGNMHSEQVRLRSDFVVSLRRPVALLVWNPPSGRTRTGFSYSTPGPRVPVFEVPLACPWKAQIHGCQDYLSHGVTYDWLVWVHLNDVTSLSSLVQLH